jgi:hypothetical protein
MYRCTPGGVVRQQRGAVKIGKIEQRSKMRGSRYTQRALYHTSSHHKHSVGARNRNHSQGLAQASTFCQLDVYPIHNAGKLWNIAGHDTRLIGNYRKLRPLPHKPQTREILRRQRLLHKLHAKFREKINHTYCVAWRPRGVGIYTQYFVGRQLAHDLRNGPLARRSQLDLQNRIFGSFKNTRWQIFLAFRDANRKTGRRAGFRVKTPQTVKGNA